MSGFFALRRDVFRRLDDGTLDPSGFKVLLYLFLTARRTLGADRVTVREVSYAFRERLHGKSKLTSRVVWEYVRMLYHFRRAPRRRR
jgi:hypothetical protein